MLDKYRAGQTLTPDEARAITPSRAEFEGLWRYLRARAPVIADSPVGMSRAWAKQTGCDESLGRTVVGLDVFRERGLIDLTVDREALSVTVRPRGPKVVLEESPILIQLHAWAEEGY